MSAAGLAPLLALLALLALCAAVIRPTRPSLSFTDTELCLGCICEATSNCNLTVGCVRGLCGPLLIARDYWLQAGSPTVGAARRRGGSDYEKCVQDPTCAATTVKNYIGRYAQDCNQDGRFDCDDVARIHYLGGTQCYLRIEHTGYYRVFKQCMDNVRQFITYDPSFTL
ncbi:invertebrate-type lysozyme 3-like [Bacillus rossius redtenbacheri]|uniref:invertebrate-type lysozyme 3-like n=1 Tax=Bacillus rossius redtenbacheri TaxID=93214 RepID=UPI002FDEB022